ncbi:hypothetical protein [Streptomyces sp. TR06-5]|uniref:hypothetical protein n=1 Tax=unclassified Streptomyces TaxID=2593676 RepID=UPI00399F9243
MTRRHHRRGPRRRAAALLSAGALALCGCGIQPTSVPVDAGAAPSRIACVLPGGAQPAPDPQDTVVRVYLVCGSRVSPVQRSVPLPGGRTAVAAALVEALTARPDATERAAGFHTNVPRTLRITGGTSADPPGTLRLSTPPAELPVFALAQIVCTLAESEAAVGDEVIVGGPAGSGPPRRVPCTSALRNHGNAAPTAGERVGRG